MGHSNHSTAAPDSIKNKKIKCTSCFWMSKRMNLYYVSGGCDRFMTTPIVRALRLWHGASWPPHGTRVVYVQRDRAATATAIAASQHTCPVCLSLRCMTDSHRRGAVGDNSLKMTDTQFRALTCASGMMAGSRKRKSVPSAEADWNVTGRQQSMSHGVQPHCTWLSIFFSTWPVDTVSSSYANLSFVYINGICHRKCLKSNPVLVERSTVAQY